MSSFEIRNIAIKGLSACVPKQIDENCDLSIFHDDEVKKFISLTGIERRRISRYEETASDLCLKAANILLSDLGWEKESIDCLIFVSQTPDYILPTTSCILQERIGLRNDIYTLDISLGCSGWVYGLSTISSLMSATGMKRGLLLAGDTVSKICAIDDKSTYPLFGDAGSATALEFEEGVSTLQFVMNSDGSGHQSIIVPSGGYRNPFSEDSLTSTNPSCSSSSKNATHLILEGMDVFSLGITKAPESVRSLCDSFNHNLDQMDYCVFHQANLFMNEKIRKKLNLNIEKVPYSLRDYGNTSCASIPLTMVYRLSNELKKRELDVIACGFGVGLSWGSVYFHTDKISCPEIVEL